MSDRSNDGGVTNRQMAMILDRTSRTRRTASIKRRTIQEHASFFGIEEPTTADPCRAVFKFDVFQSNVCARCEDPPTTIVGMAIEKRDISNRNSARTARHRHARRVSEPLDRYIREYFA